MNNDEQQSDIKKKSDISLCCNENHPGIQDVNTLCTSSYQQVDK